MSILFEPMALPCGVVLKNRIVKAAMSDSLGDGTGHPTSAQQGLYRRWAEGGAAVSIIGEVQSDAGFAEKPGNLVLNHKSNLEIFRALARACAVNNALLWPQLGHAGAMAYPPTSRPKGPSALDLPGMSCAELTVDEIKAFPAMLAATAQLARDCGFGGVEIHAAHGFLLSQFLSPLFNKRTDVYGRPIEARMRLLLETVDAVRDAVGKAFPVAVKLNASDQLEGGLDEEDSLKVVDALGKTSIDLIDISGGTYFPGAKSASDSGGKGPYFIRFAKRARDVTDKPLMVTGGFKTRAQAEDAIVSGAADFVGLARALALEPSLVDLWQRGDGQDPQDPQDPVFPKFSDPPEGGVTAWYTMRLTQIGDGRESAPPLSLADAIDEYEARDRTRTQIWNGHFS